MSISLFAVVVDCQDPEQLAQFWTDALQWRTTRRNDGEFQVSDPDAGKVSLYFMRVPEPKVVKNRLHLDVVAAGPMEPEVERLIELGASLVAVRQDPDTFDNPDSWTVLTDPEGNEFCVTSTSTLTGWA
jgi:predicted enzyme related to lactoylglutathione lyase